MVAGAVPSGTEAAVDSADELDGDVPTGDGNTVVYWVTVTCTVLVGLGGGGTVV